MVELSTGGCPDLFGGSGHPPVDNSLSFLIYKALRTKRELHLKRKIRILVAEDDPSFARMLDDSLKESGSPYRMEKVSSGQDCLQRLQQKKFKTKIFTKF